MATDESKLLNSIHRIVKDVLFILSVGLLTIGLWFIVLSSKIDTKIDKLDKKIDRLIQQDVMWAEHEE